MIKDQAYIAERDRRVALLNRLMEENKLDALVLTATSQFAYQVATKYVSG